MRGLVIEIHTLEDVVDRAALKVLQPTQDAGQVEVLDPHDATSASTSSNTTHRSRNSRGTISSSSCALDASCRISRLIALRRATSLWSARVISSSSGTLTPHVPNALIDEPRLVDGGSPSKESSSPRSKSKYRRKPSRLASTERMIAAFRSATG